MNLKKAYVEFITGPMFSGKTYNLVNILNTYAYHGNNVLCFENPHNTRRSARDLNNISNNLFTMEDLHFDNEKELLEKIEKAQVVGFDEIHFYFLFNKNDKYGILFKKLFQHAREHCEKIYLSGLFHDSNKDNQIFDILQDILFLFDRIEIVSSGKPCYKCQKKEDVIYCEKKKGFLENVGDHYEVICYNCYNAKEKKIKNSIKPLVGIGKGQKQRKDFLKKNI